MILVLSSCTSTYRPNTYSRDVPAILLRILKKHNLYAILIKRPTEVAEPLLLYSSQTEGETRL